VIFQFIVPIAVHLPNVYAKFHKVMQIDCLGEVENVYITVWQIYIPNFIRVDWVFGTI